MRGRIGVLLALVLVVGAIAVTENSAPATAQSDADPQATVAALETKVAKLETSVAKRDEKIDAQRTRIAELKASDSSAAGTEGTTPVPTIDPNAPRGSRTNPVPLGTPIQIGDWVVSVVSSIPNANDLVLAENMFNDPPAAGRQFFVVRIHAEYKGTESAVFAYSVSLSAVGATGVAYEEFDDYCGVVPDELSTAEVFPGAVIEGNVCWSVRTSDADTLVVYADELFAFEDDSRVYFAVR